MWYETPEASPATIMADKKMADLAAMWTPAAQERYADLTRLPDSAAHGTTRMELGYLHEYKQAAEQLSRKAN